MKHIKTTFLIIIASLFIFSGCTTLKKYSVASYDLDLTQFEKEGLFVTTGDCFQKYKSISILTVECYEGYVPKENVESKKKKGEKNTYKDDIYGSTSTSSVYGNPSSHNYRECQLADLFSEIINQAKQRGANGVIKLGIRPISKKGASQKTTQYGIEVVGLAIDIEN